MVLGGSSRDVQLLGDLPVRARPREQPQHLDLPVAQSGGPELAPALHALSGSFDNRRDCFVVELPRLRGRPKLLGGVLRIQRVTMRALLGHRLEGICSGQHPRGRGISGARQPRW